MGCPLVWHNDEAVNTNCKGTPVDLDVWALISYLWMISNSFCPGLEPGRQERRLMALPGFKVVTLTDAAANRIKEIIGKAERAIVGVRVGVKNGGCAGMSYTMEYAENVNPLDEVVEDKGVTVLIDPKAVLFLLGTEMDFQTTKMSSQFVFNNPNQTSACGCGESVAITPATPTPLQTAG
jgi:iron-sulfur cluster assembly protein